MQLDTESALARPRLRANRPTAAGPANSRRRRWAAAVAVGALGVVGASCAGPARGSVGGADRGDGADRVDGAAAAGVDVAGEPAAPFGVWAAVEGGGLLSIAPERVVWERDGEVQFHLARVTPAAMELFFYGSVERIPLDLGDEGLVVGQEPPALYVPASVAAASLELEPLTFAPPVELEPQRVAELTAELIARGERDQEVREALQGGATSDVIGRMIEVDRENTARIIELLGEVGWIDPERFGGEAARAAFLIVQHSGDSALMAAALPFVRAEVEAGRIPGGHYALMHDRLELALGRPQRFGSQLFSTEGNPTVLAPLEDPEGVDGRRAAMGLEPLAEYLTVFAEDGGPPEPFDWDTAPSRP